MGDPVFPYHNFHFETLSTIYKKTAVVPIISNHLDELKISSNTHKYCDYHQATGHDIEEHCHVRDFILQIFWDDYLKEYIARHQKASQREIPESEHQIDLTALCMITIIHIVPASDFKSRDKKREQVRRAENLYYVYKFS